MQIKTFPIRLTDSFMITPKVKHFIFSCDPATEFTYLPGQFITIHFEHNGKQLRRSYSIANAPKEDNRIEFAAGYFAGGPGTELLFNLKPGETLQINGAFGRLTLKDEIPTRYILMATSTGITPYRAMLTELALRMQQNPQLKVVVLQGVQKREDILYADEFHAFAKDNPQVLFKACLSRETAHSLQKNEYSGYVQTALAELHPDPLHDRVYLCGNPGMIDESFNQLKNQGFPLQHIIREKYISS